MQQVVCCDFARAHRAFHKALPIPQMFAGKEHLTMCFSQQRTNAKPLARTIHRVCAMNPRVILPWLSKRIDECRSRAGRDRVKIAHQLCLPVGYCLRGQHIGLIAYGVRTENSARTGLPLGTVKILMGCLVAHQREILSRPEAPIEKHLGLDDAPVFQLIRSESLSWRERRIKLNGVEHRRGSSKDAAVRRKTIACRRDGDAAPTLSDRLYRRIQMDTSRNQ